MYGRWRSEMAPYPKGNPDHRRRPLSASRGLVYEQVSVTCPRAGPGATGPVVGVDAGLGLSVSYFITAKNHGGELDVVSEPGQR